MKYPIGIQTFERIINEGYVYVDKTKLELNGGMQLIKNKGDGTLDGLKRFWETGRGSLGIKIPVEDMWIEGDHGFLMMMVVMVVL